MFVGVLKLANCFLRSVLDPIFILPDIAFKADFVGAYGDSFKIYVGFFQKRFYKADQAGKTGFGSSGHYIVTA